MKVHCSACIENYAKEKLEKLKILRIQIVTMFQFICDKVGTILRILEIL